MNSDHQIQLDILDELRWDPFLTGSEIGVTVKNGIAILSGTVDSYSKKIAAERVAKSIGGVRAVVENLEVGISPQFHKTDTEIAEAVLNALEWNAGLNGKKIKVRVEDGTVVLEGEVEWEFQRLNARGAVENLAGVKYVSNQILVRPTVIASGIDEKIADAFRRSAIIDSKNVSAVVSGTKVTLNGSVRSFAEKLDAEKTAWAAPGVTQVENNLEVGMPYHEYTV